MDIAGKIALVTGGASGIGKAMVEIMLQKQAKGVFIVDIDGDAMKQTQDNFHKEYGVEKVHVCKCNVTSYEQMEECFKRVVATYGALHIVCNNVGILNEVEWERMVQINLNGVIIGTKLAVQHMEGENCGGGVIINTSSRAALSLVPYMPVMTSKLAIVGYTREVATFDPIVVRKKIRVNAICTSTVVNTNLLSNIKLENETYQQIFQPLLDSFVENVFRPQDFAEHFVKLIEEPHHGGVVHVEKDKFEMTTDDTKLFRQRTGLEDTYTKLRDTAVLSLSSPNAKQ
ncbi:15-hydroxyprostaglandin dehydrogenase [NAD(+)]-like [Amphiura filiformis]|uniref:15-hydroxyprostaglandin dehydrogenase [NAD(+)]-like n=1 Tax=Amphiura filiformis TaxID=82378 RepID=UPI003B2221A3